MIVAGGSMIMAARNGSLTWLRNVNVACRSLVELHRPTADPKLGPYHTVAWPRASGIGMR